MPTPALAQSSLPEPTAETRQLINALFQPGMALTQEQAVQWKQSLRQLLQEGAAAVPAMREFLARNLDLDFGLEGSQILGYASVRTAMLDALQQIGSRLQISATQASQVETRGSPATHLSWLNGAQGPELSWMRGLRPPGTRASPAGPSPHALAARTRYQ